MIVREMTLRNYAGQGCDAKILVRDDGSVHVAFRCDDHSGHPSLSLKKLKELVIRAEKLT